MNALNYSVLYGRKLQFGCLPPFESNMLNKNTRRRRQYGEPFHGSEMMRPGEFTEAGQ